MRLWGERLFDLWDDTPVGDSDGVRDAVIDVVIDDDDSDGFIDEGSEDGFVDSDGVEIYNYYSDSGDSDGFNSGGVDDEDQVDMMISLGFP